MKKMLLVTLLLLGFSSVASAIPTTWVDSINFNPDLLVPPSRSYFHDISDDGFNSSSTISSIFLEVGLYDDNSGLNEYKLTWHGFQQTNDTARIIVSLFDWSYVSVEGTSAAPIIEPNWAAYIDLLDDGTLNVNVSSKEGDFYLDYSTLTVNGDDGTAPVPEPATFILLGSGLAGLAFYRRKRKN